MNEDNSPKVSADDCERAFKEVTLDDVIDLMIEKLESGGTVTFTPSGTSMMPMLRDGKDAVTLKKHEGRLNMFDIALFRYGGKYILHRMIDVESDGSYVMRGDNLFTKERGVKDSDIIAVVTSFHHKGKPYQMNALFYKLYVQMWYRTTLTRRIYEVARYKLSGLFGSDDEEEGTKKRKKDKKKKKNEY